jgi:hypothetical protein
VLSIIPDVAATPSNGDAQIRRAAEETAPSAQIVRTDGDLLVYYSGFNLSKFVRFLALQPHVVSQDGAAQASQDEMENYRLALAWIKGQSTDPQAKEIAATALDAYSVTSPLRDTP